jgi:hypothetical protein
MTKTPEPQLAPPGAGLPALEHLIARVLFGLRRKTGSRASFTAKFQHERAKIRALLGSVDAESGARHVLIARCRGLEDSSRHWSVWMTLDHLRIVNLEMARVISNLASGLVPPGAASTAAVKPSLDADASVVADYEASCDTLLATAAAVPDLNTAARFAPPWFGEMNASDWYALAGGHMGIHRTQIERIVAGLV